MNLRRGLFRLWLVGSALFVLAVAFVSYAPIKKEFDDVTKTTRVLTDERAVGLLCSDARGTADADYLVSDDHCWYAMSKFRRLYPEHKDVADNDLSKLDPVLRIATKISPWKTVGPWASVAFGIPLAVLALGASLLWALSGFAAERKP